MITRCQYCGKEIEQLPTGFSVCECEIGQREWVIGMAIQGGNDQMKYVKEELKDIRKTIQTLNIEMQELKKNKAKK